MIEDLLEVITSKKESIIKRLKGIEKGRRIFSIGSNKNSFDYAHTKENGKIISI